MNAMSPAIDKIAPALVASLSAMNGAVKDAKNPHFKNVYASLESVIDAAKPALAANNIAFMQSVGELTAERSIQITTTLLHSSGQFIQSTMDMPVVKLDPQAAGSAITYGRRYALMAMLGLPAIDDDGEEAMPPRTEPPPKPASKADSRAVYDRLSKANRALKTDDEYNAFWINPKVIEAFMSLPEDWKNLLTSERDDKAAELDDRQAMQAAADMPMNSPRAYVAPSFEGVK